MIVSCLICGNEVKKRGGKYCSRYCFYIAEKGHKAWNEGLTKENDARMQQISDKLMGHEISEEHRKKLSLIKKGNQYSKGRKPWHAGKMAAEDIRLFAKAEKMLGREVNEVTREKLRIASTGNKRALGNKLTTEQKAKVSQANIGNKKAVGEHNMTPEGREKLRILNSKPHDESFKEFMRNKWDEPEYVRKQMKARNVKQNKAEKKLENILNSLYPAEFKFVGDGQIIIFGKNPDFINVNGKKQIIELYGKFWHQNDNPEERELLFKQAGFKTLILWDYELKRSDVSAKIKDFVGV